MPNETDYAWAAGFLDGEGCLGVYVGSGYGGCKTHVVRVSVSSTSREVVEHLQGIIGGSVTVKSHQREGWSQGYQLQISRAAAVVHALEMLMPYIVLKRPEAELVLQFCRGITSKSSPKAKLTDEERAWRDGLVVQLHDLKGTSGLRGRARKEKSAA